MAISVLPRRYFCGLDNNGILYKSGGIKRLADNAVVALTLMIAESRPAERDIITALVVSLINRNN
jgi:hypothetical protein